jgi:cyclophilin family peptidyl-prolyl cis-trans isomerase
MKLNLVLLLAALICFHVQPAFAQTNQGSDSTNQGSGSINQGSGSINQGSGSTNQGSGTTSQLPGSSSTNQVNPETEAAVKQFRMMSRKLGENQKRIDFLLKTMPIGFAKIKKDRMAEIDKLKEENNFLQAKIYEDAFKVFAIDPNPGPQSLIIVMRELRSKLYAKEAGDKFDPAGAWEICRLLVEKDLTNVSVLFDSFQALYALEKFSEAGEILDKLEAIDKKLANRIRPILDGTKEKWQRELMIRRLESNTDDLPRVKLTTSEGDIIVELFENHAPNTVANFINLIQTKRFFDDKSFHLVKSGQYAQTGSPNNDGIGGAGYKIECECFREQIRHHFRGSLSMITSGKDQGSSQFIITHQPNSIWDGRYTVFGRVIEGMDVVYKLKAVDATRGANSIETSKLVRADILRKRSHDYVPAIIEPAVSPLGVGSLGLGNAQGNAQGSASTNGPGSTDNAAGEGVPKAPGTFDLLLDNDRDK